MDSRLEITGTFANAMVKIVDIPRHIRWRRHLSFPWHNRCVVPAPMVAPDACVGL